MHARRYRAGRYQGMTAKPLKTMLPQEIAEAQARGDIIVRALGLDHLAEFAAGYRYRPGDLSFPYCLALWTVIYFLGTEWSLPARPACGAGSGYLSLNTADVGDTMLIHQHAAVSSSWPRTCSTSSTFPAFSRPGYDHLMNGIHRGP